MELYVSMELGSSNGSNALVLVLRYPLSSVSETQIMGDNSPDLKLDHSVLQSAFYRSVSLRAYSGPEVKMKNAF